MTHYLTKKDAEERVLGIEQYIPGDESVKSLELRSSGGTTSRFPTMTVISLARLSKETAFITYFLDNIGASYLRASDRRMLNLSTANMVLRFSTADECMCVDQKDFKNPELGKLLGEYRPTSVRSFPTFFDTLITRIGTEDGARAFSNTKRFLIMGEEISPLYERRLRIVMPHAEFSPEYSFGEVGLVTVGCPHLRERYRKSTIQAFHPLPEREVEIKDPDGAGVGEIVVTTQELPRYCTGDRGRLVPETCACGANLTLEFHGRKEVEAIRARGAEFSRAAIAGVFSQLSSVVERYTVEISEVEERGRVTVTISVSVVLSPQCVNVELWKETIATEVGRVRVTPTRTISDLIEQDIFKPILVEYVDHIPKSKNGSVVFKKTQ